MRCILTDLDGLPAMWRNHIGGSDHRDMVTGPRGSTEATWWARGTYGERFKLILSMK